MPLILVPVALFVLLGWFLVVRARQHRLDAQNAGAIAAGVAVILTVAVALYRQGVIADETGGSGGSSTPPVLLAVVGLALIGGAVIRQINGERNRAR